MKNKVRKMKNVQQNLKLFKIMNYEIPNILNNNNKII